MHEGEERCLHVTGGKTLGKEALRRPSHWLEDNIKIHLKEIGWDGVEWFVMAQNWRQVSVSYEHDNELSGSMKCCVFPE